jgi:predicted 3-demethylubiquinone-9 3-methyltransferase (glyoxalase superfamily)
MKKITPFLWFNNNAEDAINFYLDIFKNGKIFNIRRLPDSTLFTAEFELEDQRLMVINGGPHNINFTEAMSFFVTCEGQEEVDELWTKLTADGGSEGQCGWLKDKFGISWQVIPTVLGEHLNDADPIKAKYAMEAMMKMKKIVIADLTNHS